MCSTELIMIVAAILMYDSPQFYYSALPTHLQGKAVVIVLMLLYEMLTNLYLLSVLLFMCFTQAAFFSATLRRLQKWSEELRYEFHVFDF